MADKTVTYKFAAEVNQMLASIAKMQDAYKKSGQTGQQESAKLALSADQIKAKITALSKEIGGLKDVSAIRQKQQEMKDYEKALDHVLGKQKQMSGSGGAGSAVGKGAFFGSLLGGVGAQALSALPNLISGIGSAMIGGNAEMEQYQASFETLLGSAEAATALMGDLKTMGASTPFEFPGLASNANLMKSFGMETKDIVPTLKMLGDVSGGSQEKLNGLALVYSQVRAAGKLQGQDLMQMINQGFNPLQAIAERTGKTMGQLKEEMSKGAISFTMVEQAFKDVTAEGGMFHGMMEKQALTFEGLASTFRDNIGEITRDLGAPVFESAKGGLLYVMDVLKRPEVRRVVESLKDAFEDLQDKFDDPRVKKAMDLTIEALSWLGNVGVEMLSDVIDVYAEYVGGVLDLVDAVGLLNVSDAANARAQMDVNDQLIKGHESSKKLAQNTQDLVKEYEALATKSTRTAEEEARRKQILDDLNKQYPEYITSTDDFGQSLDGVRKLGEATAEQIKGLTTEITALSEESKKARFVLMQSEIQDLKSELNELGFSWAAIDKATSGLRGAKTIADLDAALSRFNETSSKTINQAKAVGDFDEVKTQSRALEMAMKLYEVRKQMLELAGKGAPVDTGGGGGGTGDPPPAPDGKAADKAAREAYDKEMAEIARRQKLDDVRMKNAEATEEQIFDTWVRYQEERIALAQRYGQDQADLDNELAAKRLENEGRVSRDSRDLDRAREGAEEETLDRREQEHERSVEYIDKLTDDMDVVGKAEAEQKAIAEAADVRRQAVSEIFSNLGAATQEFFMLNKGVSIAQATVNTYEGATKALAAYPPPFGAIAMATVIAAGLAQVAQIATQKPKALKYGAILDRPTFSASGNHVAGEAGEEIVGRLVDLVPIFREAVYGKEKRRTRIGSTREKPVYAETSVSAFTRGGRASAFKKQRAVF